MLSVTSMRQNYISAGMCSIPRSGGRREGTLQMSPSSIFGCLRVSLCKSMNPRLALIISRAQGISACLFIHGLSKEPWLNSHKGKLLWGFLPLATPEPSSLIAQTPTLLTFTAVPSSLCTAPLAYCMIPLLKHIRAQPKI